MSNFVHLFPSLLASSSFFDLLTRLVGFELCTASKWRGEGTITARGQRRLRTLLMGYRDNKRALSAHFLRNQNIDS